MVKRWHWVHKPTEVIISRTMQAILRRGLVANGLSNLVLAHSIPNKPTFHAIIIVADT